MSAKRKHKSSNEYLQYLKGELSNKERHSFERELEADPFEKEAMEGLASIAPEEAEEDLLALHDKLRRRLKRRRRIALYSIAATVASILIVGTVFLNIFQLNPEAAKESMPDEKFFMQDEPETQGMVTAEKEIKTEKAVQEKEVTPIETPVIETPAEEEILMGRNIQETIPDAAPVPEGELMAAEADELRAVEAEPRKSSRKKGRAESKQAVSSYSRETVGGVILSSEDMEPLSGASIVVKGSDSGMVADMEGRFSLVADQQEPTTVIASFVGMETEEYQLTAGADNQLLMQADMASLDEVVMVAYGMQKELNPTGAAQNVRYNENDDEYIINTGAEPEGGLEAYKMYMEKQIRFPAGDSISKREVVVLKFNVDASGTISDILTLRSPGVEFTELAISLLMEGPSWNPARDENGSTDDEVRMRIVFKR